MINLKDAIFIYGIGWKMENKNSFRKRKNGSTILSKNASKTGVSTAAPWSGSKTLGNNQRTGVLVPRQCTGVNQVNKNILVDSNNDFLLYSHSLASGDRRLANLVNLQIFGYLENLTGVWEHAGPLGVQNNIQVSNCNFRRFNKCSADLLINKNNNFSVNKFNMEYIYKPRTLLAWQPN